MKPLITVITCTHNPRKNYLERAIAALKSQTLPVEKWEYLLVDNASDRLLSSEIDLSWHPHSRHIREEQLGLTPARICGIKASTADILVFVDDDNVLDSDYLENVLKISQDWQKIGAWGGQIRGEFESQPPEWTKAYWKNLGIREFDRDVWSNLLHQYETTPCGAGICVRKVVAFQYVEFVQNDPKRLNLDRQGNQLISGGDTDLAFTACDLGLGTGLFVSLKLTHLIPSHRLEEEYLLKLTEGFAYSNVILGFLRGQLPKKTPWLRQKLTEYYYLIKHPRKLRFYQAKHRGISRSLQVISPES